MQIHWRHPHELPDSERKLVEERIAHLADGHSDLVDVWIDLEPSSGHHRSGDEHVTIHASVRRGRVVARAHAAQLEVAMRKALETFASNIWSLRERRSDRRHSARRSPARSEVAEAVEPSTLKGAEDPT